MTASWFKHDAGARRDPKIATLRSLKGDAFAFYYWALVEILAESKTNEIQKKFYPGVAADIGITLETFSELVLVLAQLDLVVETDEILYSSGLKTRLGNYHENISRRSQAAVVREEAKRIERLQKAQEEQKPTTTQSSSPPQPTTEHLIYSDLISSDLNGSGSKEGGPGETKFPFALEPKFNTPDIRKYILLVRDKFKVDRRHFDQTQFEALVMRHGCDPAKVLASLVYTVGLTSAKNIIDPPENTRAGPPTKKSNVDTIKEFIQRAENGQEADSEIDGFGELGARAPVRVIGRKT